jgi:hypothetical protein
MCLESTFVGAGTRFLHTTELCKTLHICMRDNLCVLELRRESSHVNALQCRLKCVDDKGVCSITNGVASECVVSEA